MTSWFTVDAQPRSPGGWTCSCTRQTPMGAAPSPPHRKCSPLGLWVKVHVGGREHLGGGQAMHSPPPHHEQQDRPPACPHGTREAPGVTGKSLVSGLGPRHGGAPPGAPHNSTHRVREQEAWLGWRGLITSPPPPPSFLLPGDPGALTSRREPRSPGAPPARSGLSHKHPLPAPCGIPSWLTMLMARLPISPPSGAGARGGAQPPSPPPMTTDQTPTSPVIRQKNPATSVRPEAIPDI